MKQHKCDFRCSTWPAPSDVQRTTNLDQTLSLKVIARSAALLILIAFLLLFTTGHSALTWVMGIGTLIVAVLAYMAAVLLQSGLYGPHAGIERKSSVYVQPAKRG